MAIGLMVLVGGAAWARTTADYTRSTSHPFAETVAAVQEFAKAEGYRVIGVHDIAASLAKAGIERPPYSVVEICSPRVASQVLEAEPRIGSLIPCRIAVYSQGHRTVVSAVLPTRLLALFPGAGLGEEAAAVDAVIRRVVDRVTAEQ